MERPWRSPHGRWALDLDLAEQALDAIGLHQPRAQVLRGLRAAGDAVGERVLDRLALIAGGDEAGQERVARADRRARLDRPRPDPDAVEQRLGILVHAGEAAVVHGHDRLARAELADLLDGV